MFMGLQIIVFFYFVHNTDGEFKFTNVKCEVFDKPFATIPLCKLKLVPCGAVAFNLNVTLHEVPVNNVSVNMELKKKANGYKPFMYNVTTDFCQLMKCKKRLSFVGVIMNLVKSDTNLNHTCPYDHDILVKNLILRDEMFKLLPLPGGDYLFIMRFGAYNHWKAAVNLYFTVRE